ncbi:hypothetical protein OG215_39975 (plasmid) [Streptomyces globisporus]|uniref:terpene synthase family protein n=1 Tax=Streptomyces globisporus TaxID=1908 RepID=UPI002F914F53|nr:hypothetical protein OG215_39600 [Streptomyces globisporus]WSU86682.1 hypothetical protein OG215_39975 [Streptomyces globisporus]
MPFGSRISSDTQRASVENLHWCRRIGLVGNYVDEPSLERWNLSDLTGRWVPEARGDRLDLALDAITVATVIEGYFDGPIGRTPEKIPQIIDPLLKILQCDLPVGRDPLLQAFWSVWQRTIIGRSGEWKRRAANNWTGYLHAFQAEAEIRVSGQVQTYDAFLDLRRHSGCVYPMLDLIEASYDFEVSPETYSSLVLQDMMRIVADVVDTMNDLHSVDKEAECGDPHNLVLILEQQEGISRTEAAAAVQSMLKSWCEDFIECEKRLEDGIDDAADYFLTGEKVNIRRFVAGMRDCMGGHPDWYRVTKRY